MSCSHDTPDSAAPGSSGLPGNLEEPREMTDLSDEEFQAITRAAVDWQYLVAKGGGMARKSELDNWLMSRFKLSQAAARTISNFIEARQDFSISLGQVRWHTLSAGRPEPSYADYPDLAARYGH